MRKLKIDKDTAAKVSAILHIQSHAGVEGVRLGMKIAYASHAGGLSHNYIPDEFVVVDKHLKFAEMARNGYDLPHTVAARMTARVITA